MSYGLTSQRSVEFYVIIIILFIICYYYIYYMDKSQKIIKKQNIEKTNNKISHIHNNIKSGIIRGAITGLALGGIEAVIPTTLLMSFLNVVSVTAQEFLENHLL